MLKKTRIEDMTYSVSMHGVIKEDLSGVNMDAYIALLCYLDDTIGIGNFRAVWETHMFDPGKFSNILVIYVRKEEDATLIKLKYGY